MTSSVGGVIIKFANEYFCFRVMMSEADYIMYDASETVSVSTGR
jgi:hypothetical protein